MPKRSLPKIVEDPAFLRAASYLFQRCSHWGDNGNSSYICTSREIPRFKNILSSLRDAYRDIHDIPLSCGVKSILHITSFPDHKKEHREYGYLSVIFCDADVMFNISGRWHLATREEASQGIVVSGALNPILPSTPYICVGKPRLLVSFSLEPEYTFGDTRKLYQDYVSFASTLEGAHSHNTGPETAAYF